MPNIIETLRDTYATDKAAALNMLPELFRQHEDGLIQVLPCKVGNKCYILTPSYSTVSQMLGIIPAGTEIAEMDVWSIGIRNGSIWITDGDRYSGAFGKNVFLTRVEAEQALKERDA